MDPYPSGYPVISTSRLNSTSRLPSRNASTIHLTSLRPLPPRVPAPSYRHASPCGPWPWVDFESVMERGPATAVEHPLAGRHPLSNSLQLPPNQARNAAAPIEVITNDVENHAWTEYPQSLFPNWTPQQLSRSGIADALLERKKSCIIHHVDVLNDGTFAVPKKYKHVVTADHADQFWEELQQERAPETRVRAIFIENLSGPVLQMIGTKYNIEPFFFSSSFKWIPTRYQSAIRPQQGDHITVTLTFLRSMQESTHMPFALDGAPLVVEQAQSIATQGPLVLRSSGKVKVLILDLLSVHMVRTPDNGSTIISYHPPAEEWRTTTAEQLHTRLRYAGHSVFWQNILKTTKDPTLVLVTILWHALYAWDEAMEELYEHICSLESHVIHTLDMQFTQELHIMSAHVLHYSSLLSDFKKSVTFIMNTPNPALDHPDCDTADREHSDGVLKKQCNNILEQIERMEAACKMHGKRLANVQNLVFHSINIQDSRDMRRLTEATVRDSTAMKQISYLTMIFLPASFAASLFGMNITELSTDGIGNLANYLETVIPISLVTIWVLVAARSKAAQERLGDYQEPVSFWARLLWPVWAVRSFMLMIWGWVRMSGGRGRDVGSVKAPTVEVASDRAESVLEWKEARFAAS
ncbi:hypothetical protein BDV98DRAFT_654941 [Pterulicium gracile]|uniref:Cora-like Mg2+ transporter protein-domain-containing protein n=1 Tax=Pterulicium gracile TaxID=1884261 RepID=A0A5C3QQH2_9AGAR|nr:hypothetical protein BDV98DRAFT_654941 [Pterula gracilis]